MLHEVHLADKRHIIFYGLEKNNGDILMLEFEKSLVLPIHYSVSPSNISTNVAILTVLKNGHCEIQLYVKANKMQLLSTFDSES